MKHVSKNRFEDIRRTRVISECLKLLDQKSYLFRMIYDLGWPKFTDVEELRGQPMTAFVGMGSNNQIVFCWGRKFFDRLLDNNCWPPDPNAPNEVRSGQERVTFILAHETLHVALRHVERSLGKHPVAWNWACDIVVNWMAKEVYGLHVLPALVTHDRFPPEWGIDPTSQTTEEIYEILLQNVDVVPSFAPGHGHHDGWENLDERSREILKGRTTEAVEKAARRDDEEGRNEEWDSDVTGMGKLPGNAACGELREASREALVDCRIPWEQYLSRYLGSIYQPVVAERWDRLPTRLTSAWGRLVLPSQRPDWKIGGIRLLTAIDASASMTDDDVERMRSVHRSLPEDKYEIWLASFDRKCYPIESLDGIRGRGGTSVDDVDRYAEEIEADVVVVFTDGHFRKPDLTNPQNWFFVIDGTADNIPRECSRYVI